ncbi:MAG: hypothetical protein PHV05_11205 [Candidatus Riflebacteria bacterium]|nr:hypothetical protein [Candidatus Riflebacteria bacterium]
MDSQSKRWKVKAGILVCLVFLFAMGWYATPWAQDHTPAQSAADKPEQFSQLRLRPLTVSFQEDAATNLDISLEVVFSESLQKELDIREGELRAEFTRHLTKYGARKFLEDFQKDFLTTDLQKIANSHLGLTTSESRVIKVNVVSLNFGYSPAPVLSEPRPDMASSGAFLSNDQKTSLTTRDESRFDDPPTGSLTPGIGRATLGIFATPVMEWPSRTLTLEVEVLCADFMIMDLYERRGELRKVTISHLSKYPPAQLIESFLDGTLQESLRRLYDYTVVNGFKKSPIHSVYFPTFHLSYSVAMPKISQKEKPMFVFEEITE